ncbi:hypothetical protein D3C73_1159200 [compost metagenome]
MWSENNSDEDKEPLKRGELLFASISFLKQLCVLTECELIFEVQIKRELKYKSYSGDDADGYRAPENKIYIFSPDGKLRDTETYYQLGQETC